MRRALFVVALMAPSFSVALVLLQGCIGAEPPFNADASDAATDGSPGANDAASDADAKVAVPCDAAPPSTPALRVQCLDDGGTCTTPANTCCPGTTTSVCESQASCVSGFNCDKASDCTAGICCATISAPDTSVCPASSITTQGTTCTTSSSCGIGQVELCVVGQPCQDSSKKCKLVDVAVQEPGLGLTIGHRRLGACY